VNIDTILTVVSALGGYKALEFLITTFLHRTTNARKEDASADAAEIQNLLSVIEKLNKQIERYDDRLKQRDDKVDTIYRDWRNSQNEVQSWTQKYYELEIWSKETELHRCDVRGCPNRIPPSDY